MAKQALAGQRIVLAVTGSIAAYKAADLTRRLREAGAEIRVVMTKAACEFITPLTLQTLSGHPVAIELLDADQESAMGHIALARWASWILIAPASADTIARLAFGRADDLLSATVLATEARLAIAPAMNNKMWSNVATKDNLATLQARGAVVLGPASGDQACGEQGEGRLLEPVDIVAELASIIAPGALTGKRVMITAGPTYEAIDPVRYIANRSSGKMGFALAEAALAAGAEVILVTGPVHLVAPSACHTYHVESAAEMLEQVMMNLKQTDIFIACAAVADFRPAMMQTQKIKKQGQQRLMLELEATTDIIASVSASVDRPTLVVGFAAETELVSEHANKKREQKGMDVIAGNQVGNGLGFASDENALEVFWSGGNQHLPRQNKRLLAKALMTILIERYNAKNTT